MEDYEPEYAKDRLLVSYNLESVTEEFAREYGAELGRVFGAKIELENEWNDNIFLYRIEGVNIDLVKKEFEKRGDFLIGWVDYYDVKFERRWGLVEDLERLVNKLRDDIPRKDELDVSELRRKLDELEES